MGSAGYAGAPVSKTLSIITALSTLIILSQDSQSSASLVGSRVFGDESQWWRVVTSMFPLGSVWELLLTLHAIRMFRIVERHLGSAKFGSFLILAAVLSKSIEVALCVQFPFFRPPLGPLAVMSALASTYYGYIPAATPIYFAFGDVQMTEKTFAYAAVLVLAFHDRYNSATSAGCGVIVALLYWSSISPLQRFRMPGQRLFRVVGAALPGRNQIEARREQTAQLQNRMGGGRQVDQAMARMAGAGAAPGLRQRMEIPAPSEENIALLMGLGFDRDTVIRVLRSSGNNTEAAANRLLGH